MVMKNVILLALISVLFNSLIVAQTEDLVVEYRAPEELTYGSVIDFDFFTIRLKNDRKRRALKNMERHFTVSCTNGYFYFEPVNDELRGHLVLAPYPENYTDSVIELSLHVKYNQGKEYVFEQTFNYTFVLNGERNMHLNYSGDVGSKGRLGVNERLVGLIFNFGGNEGENGVNGQHGSDVVVKMAPHYTVQGDSVVLVEVFDTKDSILSIYRIPQLYTQIHLDISGGDGGDGGKGQRGSNTISRNKDGGDGGDGGNGGNGGSAKVFIHPTLSFMENNLQINYMGGKPGTGGEGGRGGKSGKKSSNPFEGVPGKDGVNGKPGIPGNKPVIVVTPVELDWN